MTERQSGVFGTVSLLRSAARPSSLKTSINVYAIVATITSCFISV